MSRFVLLLYCAAHGLAAPASLREVPRQHPYMLGSRAQLARLATGRAAAYRRVVGVARKGKAGDHEKMISMALVAAIERDRTLGKQAVQRAMKYVDGPIKKGHTPFGSDLARCAIVYDLCHEAWEDAARKRFHQ